MSQQQSSVLSQQQTSVLSQQKTSILFQQKISQQPAGGRQLSRLLWRQDRCFLLRQDRVERGQMTAAETSVLSQQKEAEVQSWLTKVPVPSKNIKFGLKWVEN